MPLVIAFLLVSAWPTAKLAFNSDTLVVVLQKQDSTRETHSQPMAAEDCRATLQLFKALKEKGQPLTLNIGVPFRGTAKALDIFCIKASGEAVDWRGTALTREQVQRRTDELIAARKK